MRQFFILFVALWVCAFPAFAQEDDKGYLTRLLQDALSDAGREVSIDGFAGSLSSQATLDRMTISDDAGVWLTLRDVVLNWNRSALLSGRVEVETLTAASLDIPRAPETAEDSAPPAEAAGFSLPELPVSIDIKELKVDRISLGPTLLGQPLEISLEGAAQLSDGSGQAKFSATRVDDQVGRFAVTAGYAKDDQTITLDLDLAEDQGGLVSHLLNLPGDPSVDLSLDGTGPLNNFAATLGLSTDGQERLAGDVTLLALSDDPSPARRFAADISGDITALFAPQYRDFFGDDIALVIAATRAADGALEVSDMALTTQRATLQGQARLNAQSWPTFLAIEGRIEDASGAPVLLPIGDVETRIASADLAINFDASTGDKWDGAFDVLGLARADVAVDRMQLIANGTLDQGNGAVTADLSADVLGIGGLTDALAKAIGADVNATAQIAYARDEPLSIPSLYVAGRDYELNGKAEIDTLGSGFASIIDLALNADDLGRFDGLVGQPLTGAAEVRIAGDVAALAGTFDLGITGSATDLAIGQDQADAVLRGVTRLDIKAKRDETGTFVDSARIANAQVRLDADASLRTGASQVSYDLNLFDARLLAAELEGPLLATGTATQQGDVWSVDTSADGPFGMEAFVKGVATGPDMNLAVQAKLPEISRLLPDLTGPISVDGTAKRIGDEMQIDATAQGADFGLVTDALVDMTGGAYQTDLMATVTASNLARFAALAGQPLAGAADLRIIGQVLPLDQHFDLKVTGSAMDARIGQKQADAILRGRTDLNVVAKRDVSGLTVETLRVANDALALTADGELIEGAGVVNYDLNLRDTRVLSSGLQGPLIAKGRATMQDDVWSVDTSADGPFGVTAMIKGVATGPDADLTFAANLPDTGVFVPDVRGPLSVDGTLKREGSNWRINTDARGVSGTTATIAGTVSDSGTPDLTVRGSAPLGLSAPFIAPRNLQGTANFDLALRGAFGLDGVSGQIATTGARLTAPSVRIALEDLDVNVGLASGRASVNGSANVSSGGRVRFSGPVGLTGNLLADVQVALEQVEVVDPTLYRSLINGTLAVTGPLAGGARITGALAIGETEISVPASGFTSIGEIPEISHVGASGAVVATQSRAGLLDRDTAGSGAAGPGFPLNIDISAPARIFVRGRGLDAELGGQLTITGTTTRPISAGRFDLVRGRLDILEQRFDLDEGSIQMQGDLVPFIRFVATTDTSTGTASIIIEGPADEPTVSFASNPDGPQDEVLSQLLFGRDLSQISALQALQLANAVGTLAGRQGVGLISRLRQGFGLDDLDISTNDDGSTDVTAGKYISDNVYTDVTVGSQGDSEVSINIDLTPNITAKGSVGSDGNTGIGLYFQKDY